MLPCSQCRVSKETYHSDQTFVQFALAGDVLTFGVNGFHAVEWNRLAVPHDRFEAVARVIAAEHVSTNV